jgi:hypothetical protein
MWNVPSKPRFRRKFKSMNEVPGSFSEVDAQAISSAIHYSTPQKPLGHASVVLVSTESRLKRVELQDSIQNFGGASCFKPARLLKWTVPTGIWLRPEYGSTYFLLGRIRILLGSDRSGFPVFQARRADTWHAGVVRPRNGRDRRSKRPAGSTQFESANSEREPSCLPQVCVGLSGL